MKKIVIPFALAALAALFATSSFAATEVKKNAQAATASTTGLGAGNTGNGGNNANNEPNYNPTLGNSVNKPGDANRNDLSKGCQASGNVPKWCNPSKS